MCRKSVKIWNGLRIDPKSLSMKRSLQMMAISNDLYGKHCCSAGSYFMLCVFTGVEDRFLTYWLCSKCGFPYENNRGVCGNKVRKGRHREACGADLTSSICYPYRPISTWLIDIISRYGRDNFQRL